MTNWAYASQVPTKAWRSANTLPRDLHLKQVNGELLVTSTVVPELKTIEAGMAKVYKNLRVDGNFKIGAAIRAPYSIDLASKGLKSFEISLTNDKGGKLTIGYDEQAGQYFIDRTKSGNTNFSKDFPGRFTAPRFVKGKAVNMKLVIDEASVELFADDGLSVMTCIYFPVAPLNHLALKSEGKFNIDYLKVTKLASIWKQ